jgi:hypothetical protein
MNIKKLLKEYINNNLEQEKTFKMRKVNFECCGALQEDRSIDDYLDKHKDENKFQKLLFKLIDDRNLKDSDVYNKVNIDRRLFSKIRSDEDYHPSKETVILLGASLELSEDELCSLLNSASYSLPKNNYFDLIIRFCFINHIYSIDDINDLLYEYKCNLLN